MAILNRRGSVDEQIDMDSQQSFLVFRLNQQFYALSVDFVVQIVPMVTIKPLPRADKIIEGLINVRGESVVVVNLCRRLGLPEEELGLHTPILLVRVHERVVGLVVDEVSDVLSLSLEDVVHSNEILPDGLGEIAVLLGVVQHEVGTIFMIDIDHLFSSESGREFYNVVTDLIGMADAKKELADELVSGKKTPQTDEPSIATTSPTDNGEKALGVLAEETSPPNTEDTEIEASQTETPEAELPEIEAQKGDASEDETREEKPEKKTKSEAKKKAKPKASRKRKKASKNNKKDDKAK